jgi:hypothetical protein
MIGGQWGRHFLVDRRDRDLFGLGGGDGLVFFWR